MAECNELLSTCKHQRDSFATLVRSLLSQRRRTDEKINDAAVRTVSRAAGAGV
jgi:hypothetical protein